MDNIMDYLHSQLKPGYKFMVCLMSAMGKEGFYEKFGLKKGLMKALDAVCISGWKVFRKAWV